VAKRNGMNAEINEIAKKWVQNLPKEQATKMRGRTMFASM